MLVSVNVHINRLMAKQFYKRPDSRKSLPALAGVTFSFCRYSLVLTLIFIGCKSDPSSSPVEEPLKDGEFQPFNPIRSDLSDDTTEPSTTSELATLGYLSGYRTATEVGGVRISKPDQMQPGYTLFTSGHGPEALLVDETGTVVHSWRKEFAELSTSYTRSKREFTPERTTYWRHATLLPEGELLAIFEGVMLLKLDRNSNVVWTNTNHAHHDLQVLEDGRIVVLARKVIGTKRTPILEDFIVTLNSNGEEQGRISILKAIVNSPFKEEIVGKRKIMGDITHTNSIQVVPPGLPLPEGVEVGDYLILMRETDALAIISKDTNLVVWAYKGPFRTQHYARLSARPPLLTLFDNSGISSRSRMLTYSFPNMNLLRSYPDDLGPDPFFTKFCGLAQLLNNDNVLLVESEAGRILEVTAEDEIVWEYISPFRAGKENEMIALLAHAQRVSPVDWDPEAEPL